MSIRDSKLDDKNLYRVLWVDAVASVVGPLVALAAIRIPASAHSIVLRLWIGFLLANLVLWTAVAVGGLVVLLFTRPARREEGSPRPLTINELEELYHGNGAIIDSAPAPEAVREAVPAAPLEVAAQPKEALASIEANSETLLVDSIAD